MKERIVINQELSEVIISNKDNVKVGLFPKTIVNNADIEQVPETFEELKELCKNIKGISFGKVKVIENNGCEDCVVKLIKDKSYGIECHHYCTQNKNRPFVKFIKEIE